MFSFEALRRIIDMNKVSESIHQLHKINKQGNNHRIHPGCQTLVTLLFIFITMSFAKYDVLGLLSMTLYLVVIGILDELSFVEGVKRLRYVWFFLCMLGVANVFLDRTVFTKIGSVSITGGACSFVTLFYKGTLSVLAVYFLIQLIGTEGLFQSLGSLGIPKPVVTILMLIYRYNILLLKEVKRMSRAYEMRSPGAKGIRFSAWGSFVGMLLLRTMEQGKRVYDSMLLRGYDSNQASHIPRGRYSMGKSVMYTLGWSIVMIILRIVPVFRILGRVLAG